MHTSIKYSIIIPTYNHCNDLLEPCIASLCSHTKMTDVELIVSANGCTDNTWDYLQELQQQFVSVGMADHFQIVWSDQPLGYSGANNLAIKLAKGQRIVLLNNDVVFLPQERNFWIQALNQPFEINPWAGISCVIKSWSDPAAHDFAIFFCVMIDRKVFDTIGLLNEEYGKGGGEDTEFSIEAERAGFEVVQCLPKTWSDQAGMYTGIFPLYHKGEGTVHDPLLVPDWNDVFWRNSLLLSAKYNPAWAQQQTQRVQ